MLKPIRIIVSSAVLLLFLGATFSSTALSIQIVHFLASIQLIPASIGSINGHFVSIVKLVSVILLTILWGRIYCSTICPLGATQDLFIFISTRIKKTKFQYFNPVSTIQYSIVILLILFFIFGNMIILNLLDPYSIFSRIITDLINPLSISINNALVLTLKKIEIHTLPSVDLHEINMMVVLTSGLFLLLILLLTIFKGRFYCSQVCPVGIILGFISHTSIFNIDLDREKCIRCGKCENICKAGCIDSKNKIVDQSNCIRCFNCLDSCPVNAIRYKINKPQLRGSLSQILHFLRQSKERYWPFNMSRSLRKPDSFNSPRRSFIESSLKKIFMASVFSAIPLKIVSNNLLPKDKLILHQIPIIPPGAISIDHYSNHCTGCNLCVNKCPSKIIKPQVSIFGTKGIFEPQLDYTKGYCQYECNICSQVCPSSAITPVSVDEKIKIQLGVVKFIKDKCVVTTNHKDCGACAEHCPTQAVRMVDYIHNLRIPEINPEVCVGCGACEHICPVRPERAIIVIPNAVHQTAKEPETKRQQTPEEVIGKDFPF